jgi:hypothetical protein
VICLLPVTSLCLCALWVYWKSPPGKGGVQIRSAGLPLERNVPELHLPSAYQCLALYDATILPHITGQANVALR